MRYMILLLMSFNVYASDAEYKIVNSTLLINDWGQTRYIADRCDTTYIRAGKRRRLQESNRILGSCPSVGKVNVYFISVLIINTFIPNKYQKFMTPVLNYQVLANNQIGVQMKW